MSRLSLFDGRSAWGFMAIYIRCSFQGISKMPLTYLITIWIIFDSSIIAHTLHYSRYLQEGAKRGLTGQPILGGLVEKSLITHFEVLNLVPVTKRTTLKHEPRQETVNSRVVNTSLTKWRRVGFISGRNVHLDTIVWPSGDIVVTGTCLLIFFCIGQHWFISIFTSNRTFF